ncbi:hypothetical protein [Azorhizophilus paspali]|uniref:Uncharacterized protein n=1 Tax=Azorhizophilus paspali TaxID=69963 RepID=A0ABV6SIA4_AZOPA
MTRTLFYSTAMPNEQARVTGGIPTKPMRWHVDYVVKTPGGLTVVQGEKTIQHATFDELRAVMDHTIGEIGNEATFVSWRATTHGGKKKSKNGGRSR